MTETEIEDLWRASTARLCEWCWKCEWPAGGQGGYEAWGLHVCEGCYYDQRFLAEDLITARLRDAVKHWRAQARTAVPALVAELRFLKLLLTDRRLDSDEAERLARQREALALLVERLGDLPMLVEQDASLYRLVREGIATLRDDRRPRERHLADALRLVLLFYRSGPWGETERAEWEGLTTGRGHPAIDASTRGLCDHIRHVLKTTEAP